MVDAHTRLKIMTLNLWRYYGDWEKRKKHIISFIAEEKPDVVCFQEVCDDRRYNKEGDDQAHQLQLLSGYSYYTYHPVEKLRRERNADLREQVFMGLGCLSRFPIVDARLHSLKIYPEYKDTHEKANLFFYIEVKDVKIPFGIIHFSNNNFSSKLQLRETLDFARQQRIDPILLGDFNMMIVKDVFDVAEKNYIISYGFQEYKSYPPNPFSATQFSETLDYVLLPRSRAFFVRLRCGPDSLSDHRPLVAEIVVR